MAFCHERLKKKVSGDARTEAQSNKRKESILSGPIMNLVLHFLKAIS